MGETADTGACIACDRAVPTAATRCPECGYTPASHKKWFWIDWLLGVVFVVSVIGLPVGLWLLWKARGHKKAVKRGVVAG